jgi:hypothetical protein
VDVGMAYPAAGTWSGLLQLNASTRARDQGDEAEPEDSGSRQLWLSPGVSYRLGTVQLYAFVQVPLYQNMNGVQLTADRTFTTGVHWRF